MILKIKNEDSVDHIWGGQTIAPNTTFTVPSTDLTIFQTDSTLVAAIATGIAVIADETAEFSNVISAIEYLRNSLPPSVAVAPFATKTVGAKKLFKRAHGIQADLASGSNTVIFTIPYAWAKLSGITIVGGELGDFTDLFILDSTGGTYSGVANYQLNKFGFATNVAKDYHEEKSNYDADLYLNMQIKISYTSMTAKTIGINFDLNEVK